MRAYFAGTGGDGAASSVARRTAAVRSFYAYLVREGVRADDPAALLRTPKRPQELPRVLSVEEVEEILGHRGARPGRSGSATSRPSSCCTAAGCA